MWPRRSIVSAAKPLFLKELRTLWAKDNRWNETNTILVDNHAEKFERNPAGTCFLIPDFVLDKDDTLAMDGSVVKHLSGMLKADSQAKYAGEFIELSHFSFLKEPVSIDSLAQYDQTVLRRSLATLFTSSNVMRTNSPERTVDFYMNHRDSPGPRSEPFRRRHLRSIATFPEDWVVCEKTDGTRSLFFVPANSTPVTFREQEKLFGYFVDRAWSFELVVVSHPYFLHLVSVRLTLLLFDLDAVRRTGDFGTNYFQGWWNTIGW